MPELRSEIEVVRMTNKEAINVLRQVNKILVSDKSWLENTHEPLNTAFEMAIEALEQQPEWIPVSERLPQDGTEIFVYLFDRPSPYIAWLEDTHWYTEDFEVERDDEPVAWMPLPEPYKAESEE